MAAVIDGAWSEARAWNAAFPWNGSTGGGHGGFRGAGARFSQQAAALMMNEFAREQEADMRRKVLVDQLGKDAARELKLLAAAKEADDIVVFLLS